MARGLRRLARKELAAARETLRRSKVPADESVHAIRKRIKKVRAIAELIDSDDGRGLGRSRKRLRKINRLLAPLRDADAMLQTLDQLGTPRAGVDEHALARLRRRLRSNRAAASKAADDRAWAHADDALRRARRAAKDWKPAHRGFGALAAGIQTSLEDGRRALARAKKTGDAADFHEWRKRLKTLRHQLRLVEACSAEVRRDVRRLHAVERNLGEDHNVAVLCATLTKNGAAGDLEPLQRSAARRQRDLRRRALDGAAAFYARSPREYVRQIERAWKAWAKANGTGGGRARGGASRRDNGGTDE